MYRCYPLLRRFLFRFPAEASHKIALNALSMLYRMHFLSDRPYHRPVDVMGLRFENPIGLSAGLDKDGCYIDALAALGFGFIEIGTVTPKPQNGQAKPRLFRLTEDRALINRMGFNNQGVDALVARLSKRQKRKISSIPLGINIGKNYTTPMENAVQDYQYALTRVYPYADYITVNISSPNTENLRTLQYGKQLALLLDTLKKEQLNLVKAHQRHVPLVLKIAPDLNEKERMLIATCALDHAWDGIIASNTTIARPAHLKSGHRLERGGLSGLPLFPLSYEAVESLANLLQKRMALIAVGGIFSPKEAQAYFDVGADLIQLYTGFIYQGPQLIKDIALCLSQV